MAQNNQVWRFQCQGCGNKVEQGSPGDLKTLAMENGEVHNVTACSKCVIEIDKYIEKQETEQAVLDRAKPPKVLRDRPGGFPEAVQKATIAAALEPQGYAPVAPIPAPSPIEQNLMNNLTLLMGELVKGQNDIKELLMSQNKQSAKAVEYAGAVRMPRSGVLTSARVVMGEHPLNSDYTEDIEEKINRLADRPRPVQQNMPANFGQKRSRNRGRNRSR